jgi:hypothetical protein
MEDCIELGSVHGVGVHAPHSPLQFWKQVSVWVKSFGQGVPSHVGCVVIVRVRV